MKQIYNPFLPLDTCISDGEPHVFGDRVFLFGSHDRVCGTTFCELDYEVWSASVDDLSNWRSHGVVYSAKQDPDYRENKSYLYAPDVVQGNDGKFYLYYSLAGEAGKYGYEGPLSVAVSDTPGGKYEYLGYVRNADGTSYRKQITFDPAVINDDGVIRLYFGTSYFFDEYKFFPLNLLYHYIESKVFSRSYREMLAGKNQMTGAFTIQLADDMLTVVGDEKRILPIKTNGTDFAGHAFFEAASIRKFSNKYYFIYSSRNNHELCYAISDYPDKGFSYGGTLISNGDIGLMGRKPKDRVVLTGNNHGSIEKIGEKYYIFYHRMTDKSTYSRQACAEEIYISDDGSIKQVEISSSGLNGEPLAAIGTYPAAIACILTNGHMPHLVNGKTKKEIPYITFIENQSMIVDISNQTKVGYKYFEIKEKTNVLLTLRGDFCGKVKTFTDVEKASIDEIEVSLTNEFKKIEISLQDISGKRALYFVFEGKGKAQLKEIEFQQI